MATARQQLETVLQGVPLGAVAGRPVIWASDDGELRLYHDAVVAPLEYHCWMMLQPQPGDGDMIVSARLSFKVLAVVGAFDRDQKVADENRDAIVTAVRAHAKEFRAQVAEGTAAKIVDGGELPK